jgi:[ribosomal protein S5]-alanine N-acetyltransferase
MTKMKRRPILRTQNLIIRPFEPSDANDIQRLAGDKSIADTTLNIPYPYEDGMAEHFIKKAKQRLTDGLSFEWAIELKAIKKIIGAIGLINYSKRYQTAELGYWIGKSYWNNGYCSEAAKKMIEFAFSNLKMHKVYACHFKRNKASARIIQKIGMKYEGTFKEHVRRWNHFEDLVYLGILNPDWNKTRIHHP